MNQRSTSFPLIVLVLLAGVALGWLFNDLASGQRQPDVPAATAMPPTVAAANPTSLPATTLPSTTVAPSETPAPSETLAPSETPQPLPAPTEASQPTATPLPTTTPVPSAPPTPTSLPPVGDVAGYIGHTVIVGETLASIAAVAGSEPELIASYNLLRGEPAVGRALIVPQLAGREVTLASEPQLVTRGRSDQPWVALTLDAGASAEPVPAMLQALRERGVTITFFLTGKWVRENPDLTRQIVADGHEIANHTVNHPDLTRVDDDAIRGELNDTETLLREVAGEGATTKPFFRPPYGAYDKRVLNVVQGEGFLPVYWTLDSLDSVGEPKTAQFLLERVTAKLSPEQLRGAIILAHCGSAPTAEALPLILDRFAEMGFQVKKLSEML